MNRMNETDAAVVIVGAGPVGLTLAIELRLQGVDALVLERLAEPTGLSKALGLMGRSVDTLGYRGLTGPFLDRGAVAPPRMLHFSMIPLDQAKAEGLGLQGLFVQQAVTEEVLAAIAAERGVRILRGQEVTALDQDADGVTLRVSGPAGDRRLRTGYVVGCDGGASVVRKQAGIGFPGIPPTFLLRLGDVTLADGLAPQDIPGLRVPLVPLGGGYYRVVVTEAYPDDLDRDTPMALDELRASIRRVNGADVPISGARWLSRFTDSSRLADSYRAGRVLLAGDAAHIHLPAGGPGLNTGLLDAFNLGWKLAAEVQGWAPPGLLDSYNAERRPEGERVLLHTRAQGALLGFANNERVAALREVLRQLLQFEEPVRYLVSLMYALDTRYPTGCDHPLAGRWAPAPALAAVAGQAASGRGVLLDLTEDGAVAGQGQGWRDRLDYVAAPLAPPSSGSAPAAALLIRPDGYVAWAASPGAPDTDGLRRALTTWFGAASEEPARADVRG
jgi:2-polyprenyl-6-methoxyphenol hydroxylase-like FAD-dependent oxidoreductase